MMLTDIPIANKATVTATLPRGPVHPPQMGAAVARTCTTAQAQPLVLAALRTDGAATRPATAERAASLSSAPALPATPR